MNRSPLFTLFGIAIISATPCHAQSSDRPTTLSDLVVMAGLNHASPETECWLIFGFDFGKGSKNPQGYQPTTVGGS